MRRHNRDSSTSCRNDKKGRNHSDHCGPFVVGVYRLLRSGGLGLFVSARVLFLVRIFLFLRAGFVLMSCLCFGAGA